MPAGPKVSSAQFQGPRDRASEDASVSITRLGLLPFGVFHLTLTARAAHGIPRRARPGPIRPRAGEKAADGTRQTAGNWIVDRAAYDESVALPGSTTIPLGSIAKFEIVTGRGRVLLTIPAR